MKTTTYGVTHLLVAIAVVYGLTGSWQAALAVGLVEPVVQTVAFAVHERLWARVGARDRAMRTAKKTATYLVMHFAVAVGVVYALTGSWRAALAVGMVEPLVQTVAFAFHEGIWVRADTRRRSRIENPRGDLAAA